MQDDPLWMPSAEQRGRSQLAAFARTLAGRGLIAADADYEALHRWSIEHPGEFWSAVWDFCGIRASVAATTAVEHADRFDQVRWFPGARLNFAENLLRYDDDQVALVGLAEGGARRTVSYREMRARVAELAAALRESGLHSGDRVAGFMPNCIETVVAMLATASLGAVWTSCSPDFGLTGAQDRFGQVQPRVLFTADGYRYNGKTLDALERAARLAEAITSIEQVVVVSFTHTAPASFAHPRFQHWADFCAGHQDASLTFLQLPFDHPLYVLYSSGTTGAPKCIVHGAGGTLLQHRKEHVLHTDLRRKDVFFYFTTCGWMMWNWLVSGLASGCTLVLYDGSPFAANGDALLDAIEAEGISVFGVGAKYIDALEKAHKQPGTTHDLSSLRAVLSTGSPLGRHSFEWVYRAFKADLCLSSISGGTDIVSCFVLGAPTLPVYAGEIQCRGLGMAVEIRDDDGNAVLGEKGELVCTRPFPCTPIGFWNDPDGERYRAAYFDRFPNVWAHGDYGEITANGGVIIHGRSDAVLNPGGVRIGTAEIYRQVEKVPDVIDSVVIGQQWGDDERVVLFVVLREGRALDEDLETEIRAAIRANATPRHVPAVIVEVPAIPRTRSGKVVELAVKNVVHGRPVRNTDAIANPETLAYFAGHPRLA